MDYPTTRAMPTGPAPGQAGERQPLLQSSSSSIVSQIGSYDGHEGEAYISRWRAFRASQTFRLVVVSMALFTDNFIYGLIVPTLPYDLHYRSSVPSSDIEAWASALLAAYGLASLLAAPALGYVAERTSNRKGPLLLGLLLQTAATIVYGSLRDVRALVAARLLQGLSAAIVYTSGLAFLVDCLEPGCIGSFIGAATSAENTGLMISPLIGGPLYARAGRNALVGMMVALIGVDIVLRLLIADPAVTRSVAATAREEATCTKSPSSNACPTSASTSSSRSPPDRLAVCRLLKNPRVLSAAYGLFLGQVFLTTFDGVLPRFVQRNYSWDASRAGLTFLALSIPSLAATLAGRLTDKYGPKWVTLAGLATSCPAFVMLIFAETGNFRAQVILGAALGLIGLAVAFITSPLASDLAIVVEHESRIMSTDVQGDAGYAQVFSIMLFAQCAGISVGPSWAGFAYKELGWSSMALSLVVLSVTGLVPILLYTGGPPKPVAQRSLSGDQHKQSSRS